MATAAGGLGKGAAKITQAQAKELNDLADKVGADKRKFCDMLNISVDSGVAREPVSGRQGCAAE